MSAPIQAITFDAAGTLFHLAEPVGVTYSAIALEFGIDLTPASLNCGFQAAWNRAPQLHSASHPDPDTSADDSERDWWKERVRETFREASRLQSPVFAVSEETMDALFDRLFVEFGKPDLWRLFPDTLPALDRLVGRAPLAVISNFDRRFHGIAAGLGLTRYFETVVLSGDLGVAKPSPEIFREAARCLGLPPERILHVGDDPQADWEGASLAGFQCFEVRRPGNSLGELIDRL